MFGTKKFVEPSQIFQLMSDRLPMECCSVKWCSVRCSTRVGSCLIHNYSSRVKLLPTEKHTSLFRKGFSDEGKKEFFKRQASTAFQQREIEGPTLKHLTTVKIVATENALAYLQARQKKSCLIRHSF